MNGARDEDLIERVAISRDERALSEIYDRYGGPIYGSGVRRLKDRSLAEDLVQDVFLSVWRKAGSFDPSQASFATWIHRIARNRTIDLARRRRIRTHDTESLFEPAESDHEDLSRNFDITEALSNLSPAHREILMLKYFKDLSQREIAEHTHTPLGTVKSRTTAALHAMRKLMFPPSWHRGVRSERPKGLEGRRWMSAGSKRRTAGRKNSWGLSCPGT